MRSASRNSATVFASTPALLAAREAPRDVVFAALRACCWRPRACPPFLAAARRFEEVPEREDDALLRLEALRLDPLRLDDPLRLRDEVDDERLLPDREPDLLLDERLLAPDLLLDDRLELDLRLDPPDFLDPPLLLPCAI